VRDEERRVVTETGPPPAEDSEERTSAAEQRTSEIPTSKVPRWLAVSAALVLTAVVGVIVYGYLAKPGWIGVSGKQFWDYLDLLIVPAALAIGVYLLNRALERERQAQEAHREREREAEAEQRERERETTEVARRKREREAQAAQTEREIEVESQRAQDAALQAYLDQMSGMLIPKNDQPSLSHKDPLDSLKAVARARTLTVLPRLDVERKVRVVQFLYESDLIKDRAVLDLSGASLSGVDLRGFNLSEANLSGADLRGADLRRASVYYTHRTQKHLAYSNEPTPTATNLSGANLSGADLRGVNFSDEDVPGNAGTNLRGANLSSAKLAFANLSGANLSGADLGSGRMGGADLSWADLSGANLRDADLEGANLTGAKHWTEEQLDQARSLFGTTMPDGQRYEEWLKDKKAGGKDEKNE
jgi:uncharacterized protein YjbI with pentapeptide repeats